MSGHTLVELVIITVIIGIISAVVLPSFCVVYDNIKIEGAYRQLMQDIKYAQHLAIARQAPHGLSFNIFSETYSVYRQNTSDIVKDPATQKPLSVTYGSGKFSGINISSTTFIFPYFNRVEFDSSGKPSSGGVITLKYSSSFLACGGMPGGVTKKIYIEANTGRVY